MTAGQSVLYQKSLSCQEASFGVVTCYSQEDLWEESWEVLWNKPGSCDKRSCVPMERKSPPGSWLQH